VREDQQEERACFKEGDSMRAAGSQTDNIFLGALLS